MTKLLAGGGAPTPTQQEPLISGIDPHHTTKGIRSLEIEIPEKIPQGSKKSQPGMGAFTTPNRKLAENASESTPRNKRKEQESLPIETPGKIPRTDQINRSLFSTPQVEKRYTPPPPAESAKDLSPHLWTQSPHQTSYQKQGPPMIG